MITRSTPRLVRAVIDTAQDITHRRGYPPDAIRCHPAVTLELTRFALQQHYGAALTGGVTLLGMRIDTDEYLPEHVWRLCDADDTLLYDCREGTPAL